MDKFVRFEMGDRLVCIKDDIIIFKRLNQNSFTFDLLAVFLTHSKLKQFAPVPQIYSEL
jgi:hypothetical protein